jgi:autotransporter-associated beta strand protein
MLDMRCTSARIALSYLGSFKKNELKINTFFLLFFNLALFVLPNLCQAKLASLSHLHQEKLAYPFSGTIVNPNTTIPKGYYADLTADGRFGWRTGGCDIDVATNSYVFTLDSGGGNPLNYSGIISGNGSVRLISGQHRSSCCAKEPLIISGTNPNTYQGITTIVRGVVELKKSPNTTAIPGDLIIVQHGGNDELRWGSSYQLNKNATLTMNSNLGALNLNGFSEKIGILKMIDGSKILTDSNTSQGQISVDELWYNNIRLANNVYTSKNTNFIIGNGSVIVGQQLPEPYEYRTMKNAMIQLYPYTGKNVALLVTSEIYDPIILNRIVLALDRAYDFYKESTGREPSP